MPLSKTCFAAVSLLGATMSFSHAVASPALHNPFGDCRIVSNDRLAKMRGGFSINTGSAHLDIAFAIERVTSINGQLQVLTQLNIPSVVAAAQAQSAFTANLSHLQILQNGTGATLTVSGPASTATPNGAASPIQVIQNGPGNAFTLPTANPSQFMTVIQNTLDNQTIRNATIINATVTNLGLVRALNATRMISRGIASSLR